MASGLAARVQRHRSSRRGGSTRTDGTVPYLGIDVHRQASVWGLLDEDGEVRGRGKVATTAPALGELRALLTRRRRIQTDRNRWH